LISNDFRLLEKQELLSSQNKSICPIKSSNNNQTINITINSFDQAPQTSYISFPMGMKRLTLRQEELKRKYEENKSNLVTKKR
jgi:hypothetical protein